MAPVSPPRTTGPPMGRARGMRIAVVGTVNWVGVAAGLLRHARLNAAAIHVDRRWVPLRMFSSPTFLRAGVAHMVWGGDVAASVVARLLRKQLVWHWIGSDVLAYARGRGWRQRLRRYLAERVVKLHLADSPELAEELAALGLESTVCRLLPPSIEAEPLKMPDRFRVLSYWFDDRLSFYGGDIVFEQARRLPDVEFLIAGAHGRGAPHLPNVRFLGRVKDLDPVYAKTSVLLRLPKHDSLSVMVLEALARGRYVVYNKDFPCAMRADTPDQVHAALLELRERTEPNDEGARMVRRQFSLRNEADAAGTAYARAFPPS